MAAKELNEMDNPVTRGAKSGDPMKKVDDSTSPGASASYEDLGGPTPQNYKPDDNSASLKSATVKTVKDIVNKGAAAADKMQSIGTEVLKQGDNPEAEESAEVVAEEPTTEETTVTEETPTVNVEEDLAALFGGEELSEEFQEKAKTIFEAAVNSKVAVVKEELSTEYEKTLTEHLEGVKSELVERCDAYLEYVSDEWLKENALEVEHGLKTEMTESFLSGMKSLFEDHYVSIPDDKYDVLESMVNKLDDMEGRLNEQIEKNVSLNKRLGESTADGIFRDIAEGLAETQKEKLQSLAEGVEFEGEEQYREKLVTLKESYFPKDGSKPQVSRKSETISEGISSGDAMEVTSSMSNYLQALSMGKK
jgi:hypothetical protein|tara:strand:- start:225 stop:1316 length:1092 start_codon:yes stop_codon:yes gene_type:complete